MAIEPVSSSSVQILVNLAEPELSNSIDSATVAILSGNSISSSSSRVSGSVQLSPGLLAQRRLIEQYDKLDPKPVKGAKKIALNTLQTTGTGPSSGKRNLTPSPASSSSSSEEESDEDVDLTLESNVNLLQDPIFLHQVQTSLSSTSNFEPPVSALDFSSPDTGSTLGKRKRSDDGDPSSSDLLADEFPLSERETSTASFNPDRLSHEIRAKNSSNVWDAPFKSAV